MRGPVFKGIVKLRTRAELRSRGYGFRRINELMDAVDDDVLEAAAAKAEATRPGVLAALDGPVGADRPILDFIIGFLQSEFGQALIEALIALLLGGLV